MISDAIGFLSTIATASPLRSTAIPRRSCDKLRSRMADPVIALCNCLIWSFAPLNAFDGVPLLPFGVGTRSPIEEVSHKPNLPLVRILGPFNDPEASQTRTLD
jgi:hypothetical protein